MSSFVVTVLSAPVGASLTAVIEVPRFIVALEYTVDPPEPVNEESRRVPVTTAPAESSISKTTMPPGVPL